MLSNLHTPSGPLWRTVCTNDRLHLPPIIFSHAPNYHALRGTYGTSDETLSQREEEEDREGSRSLYHYAQQQQRRRRRRGAFSLCNLNNESYYTPEESTPLECVTQHRKPAFSHYSDHSLQCADRKHGMCTCVDGFLEVNPALRMIISSMNLLLKEILRRKLRRLHASTVGMPH
ncbi:hypothetical protein EYF80_023437 [Liparis tanakae]|uniref:Uncharacterized protein n=1 Tax=Liparis tanakae TaxID=230148 RepID=A0A4Z2HLA0_9TELE|nr:hypothetical protein EYF80_023437 [Liparis tanakae]